MTFQVNSEILAKAGDLTYLTISKCVGWNIPGITSDTLYEKCGLSHEQINGVLNMYVAYLLILPEINPFSTQLYLSKDITDIAVHVDWFLLHNELPEKVNLEETKTRQRLIAEEIKRREKVKLYEEKFDAFTERLEHPIASEQVTFAYDANQIEPEPESRLYDPLN